MNLKPIGDRVVVKIEESDTNKSGIIIPDTSEKKVRTGIVLAVGIGRMNEGGHFEPMEVKKGDKVLFSKYSDSEVEVDGIKYITIYLGDIYGILE